LQRRLLYLILLIAISPFATKIPCFSVPYLKGLAAAISETQNKAALVLWIALLSYVAYKRGYPWKRIILEAILLNLLIFVFKCSFQSPRPLVHPKGICDWEDLGYPSGHTARAFWVALWLSEFFPKYTFLFISYGVAVAWSRVELCVHFPLDTVGGLLVALMVFGSLSSKRMKEVSSRSSSNTKNTMQRSFQRSQKFPWS